MTPTPPVAGDVRALLPCPFCACRMSIDPVARDWWRLSGDHDERCILSSSETDVPQTPEQLDVLCADWNRRSALSAASAAEPQGWRLVPVEPTDEMKSAAVKYANGPAVYKNVAAAVLRIEEGIYGEVYEAMVAAAPPAPGASQVHQQQGDEGGNGMAAALRAARALLDELAPDAGYGFFRPDNPHDFTPDSENTEEEHAAHKAACEAYDRGEYVEESPSGWLSPNVHITTAPWGPGSYKYRDPDIDAVIEQIDAALATTPPTSPPVTAAQGATS